MDEPLNVGIVGCGVISAQYLTTIQRVPGLRLAAVADLDPDRALAVADALAGVRALRVDELITDPQVEMVLNLTIPAADAEVALKTRRGQGCLWREAVGGIDRGGARCAPSRRGRAGSGGGVLRTRSSGPAYRRRARPSTTAPNPNYFEGDVLLRAIGDDDLVDSASQCRLRGRATRVRVG